MNSFLKIQQEINIGKKLRDARKSKGYTQEQVGEIIDLSNKQITDLENNRTNGSIKTIINLCNLYEISMDDLYGSYLSSSKNSKNIKGFSNLTVEQKKLIEQIIEFMVEQNK